MREMKVRVWDDVLKEMLYSRVEQFDDMLGFRFEKHLETENPIYMWSTGLHDRNGREIYEGDVLINPKGIRGEIKYVPEYAAFLAYWKHDGECGYDYLDKGILMKCEVIGNIYENPELLKGDENE